MSKLFITTMRNNNYCTVLQHGKAPTRLSTCAIRVCLLGFSFLFYVASSNVPDSFHLYLGLSLFAEVNLPDF